MIDPTLFSLIVLIVVLVLLLGGRIRLAGEVELG